jgi:hypothetical protein
MFRWKTPLGAENAVKHASHNQKKHGNRGGAVMAGARVKFGKAKSTGDGRVSSESDDKSSITYQTALDVARSQGKSEELAHRFAANAVEVMKSAPLSARPLPENKKESEALHYELLETMYQRGYTEEQINGVFRYRAGYSYTVNRMLRGQMTPEYMERKKLTGKNLDYERKIIDQLKDATENTDRVPENITVVRGVELSPEAFAKFQKGAVLSDPAFMSASINADVAKFYASTPNSSNLETAGLATNVKVVMRLRVPSGTPAIFAASVEKESDIRTYEKGGYGKPRSLPELERGEMIFPPNTNHLIRGMEQRDGVWYIDAEILP